MIRKFLCIGLISLLITFVGCSQKSKNINDNEKATNYISIDSNNELLNYFKDTHKNNEILKVAEWDVDGDDNKDLVVIYNISKDKNGMVIVLKTKDGFKISNEVSAPISNQKIEFKDIDKKAPMEIIVSGSKNNKAGYAIFRLEDMKLIDIFGDGMKDCC